jgi:hypothetical protein
MLALRKLRSTQWTGLRVLAAVVIAAGLFGTASGLTELIEKFGEGGTRASNPVVDNDQRRHAAMLENQVKDYPSNLAALSAFSAFVALVTLHFVGLAWRMFAKVPLSSIMGGLFLSASGICGLLVAPAVARVNEFAFQPWERSQRSASGCKGEWPFSTNCTLSSSPAGYCSWDWAGSR